MLLKEAQTRSDAALVAGCQEGDRTAFDEIVRRYKDRVFNVVYRYLGHHEDALDVCQEVFVKAYRGINGFRGDAKVYTWLYSIAGNLARNWLRDAGRKGRNKGTSIERLAETAPGIAQGALSITRTPREVAQEHELDALLQQCLNELPEHYRLAFVLRTFERLSYDEIASVMECPPGTVKSRLNQARLLLRERLEALEAV